MFRTWVSEGVLRGSEVVGFSMLGLSALQAESRVFAANLGVLLVGS